jgi:hypothetical protein
VASPAPPLSDAIVTAVSRLLDDHQSPRDPSHADLKVQVRRAGLESADLTVPAGKERRVRAILGWALENDEPAGRTFVGMLVSEIRGCGGFRAESKNYVGADAIENARAAFRIEGFDLSRDGVLLPIAFDGLSGAEATEALRVIARRAARGADDDPLVVGTSKTYLRRRQHMWFRRGLAATRGQRTSRLSWARPSTRSDSPLLHIPFSRGNQRAAAWSDLFMRWGAR